MMPFDVEELYGIIQEGAAKELPDLEDAELRGITVLVQLEEGTKMICIPSEQGLPFGRIWQDGAQLMSYARGLQEELGEEDPRAD